MVSVNSKSFDTYFKKSGAGYWTRVFGVASEMLTLQMMLFYGVRRLLWRHCLPNAARWAWSWGRWGRKSFFVQVLKKISLSVLLKIIQLMLSIQLSPLEWPDLRYHKSAGALHFCNLPKNVNDTLPGRKLREIILVAIFCIFCHQYD